MLRDKLLEIFEKYIQDLSRPHQSHEELIYDVVAAYIFHLMEIGNIPAQVLDDLEKDIRDEVIEIYRKKTYGYLSLHEYRCQKVRKTI
jgi:hypothetical protein